MDILKKADEFILSCGMDDAINNSSGILVAYSGGADSSLLLHYLVKRYGCERISACHVNHMIRANEADGDESFCRDTCERLGVEFYSKKINVPEIAEREGLGLEDAARRESRRATPASCAFVPSAAGLVIAGEVIRTLIR